MHPDRNNDDILIGLPLVMVGLVLIMLAAVDPSGVTGPGFFGTALLLVFGTVVFLAGASFLRVDRMQTRFVQRWLPPDVAVRPVEANSYFDRRGAMDRRWGGDRRVEQVAFDGADQRSGIDRRRGTRRTQPGPA